MTMRSTRDPLFELLSQLESCRVEDLNDVNREGGLQIPDLIDMIRNPVDHTIDVAHPTEPKGLMTDISELEDMGRRALTTGEVAYVIYVKDMNHVEDVLSMEWIKKIFFVVDPSLRDSMMKALDALGAKNVDVATGFRSFTLTPHNRLHMTPSGPELHPCGEGDVIPAVFASIGQQALHDAGVRHLYVSSDRKPRLSLIGVHLAHETPITSEVRCGDTGPVLCHHSGFDQLSESFRLSHKIDAKELVWRGTGTILVRSDLNLNAVEWAWHRLKQRVGDQLFVKYQRFTSDLTASFNTQFVAAAQKTNPDSR